MSMARLYTKKVTVKRQNRGRDGIGGFITEWIDIGSIKVRIEPVSSSERIRYQQQQYMITHQIFCPAKSDIQPGDRLYFGLREFDVLNVINPEEADHHFEIEAIELGVKRNQDEKQC